MKCNSILNTFFFSLLFLFLVPFNTLAANYGEGNYGDGDYGIGGTPTPAPQIPLTQSSAPTCFSTIPTGSLPWIYSASSNNSDSITLMFVNYQSPITHFVIEYGTSSGEYKYSVDNIDNNATSYTINKLAPATTYFFRIRTSNDCAIGSWSNEISTKTKGFLTFNSLDFTESGLAPSLDDDSKTVSNLNDDRYEVNIKVVNTNKEPVKGAKVTLHSDPRETTTDENGLATFEDVESGDHKILIMYNNFQGEQSINLSGDTKEFNLNITVTEKKVMFSPVANIIIGLLVLVIVFIVVKLKINK